MPRPHDFPVASFDYLCTSKVNVCLQKRLLTSLASVLCYNRVGGAITRHTCFVMYRHLLFPIVAFLGQY